MSRHKALSFLILILSFIAVLPSLPHASAQNAAPAQDPPAAAADTLNLAGLSDRVTVRRDERGIPYIEAANEADLYFAQGYVTASDRLWQMDLLRRNVRGEMAEIFGPLMLEEDKRNRTYGFAQMSEAMLAASSAPVRKALEAYAKGVNAYIESRDAKQLPAEFQLLQYRPRAWTPADSLVIGKLFAGMLSSTWQTDLMRAALSDVPAAKRELLLTEYTPLDVLVVGQDNAPKKARQERGRPLVTYSLEESTALMLELSDIRESLERVQQLTGTYMEDRAASNNWVVSGSRTQSGKPLLANDPHLPPLVPSIWHMTHLSMPGLRLAGVTAPGAPGILLGHNEHIAWGATNLGPDVQDLYLEKFDKENPRRYMTPGGWREVEVRREEIKVRKGFTGAETETQTLDVTVTRHGPIIFEKDGARYALRWTALDTKTVEFDAFYNLNRARNWQEFRTALSRYQGTTQNFIYADKEGHIGYYGAGRIPVRKSGDGSVPYDGSTDEGEWTGYIPFDKLPHLYDPPAGFIVTANQRVVGRSYPFHLTHEWAAPYRARRIHELLQAKAKLTPDDFREIQGDTYSIPGASFAREILKLAGAQTTPVPAGDEKWRETLKLLAGWDGKTDADSRPALLALLMRDRFRQRIVAAALGAERARAYRWGNSNSFVDRIITAQPREWLPEEFKSYLELVRACERDAREAIAKRLGADETAWTWGRYQQITLAHPLTSVPLFGQSFAIAPFPQYGSGSSVNVGQYVSMRFIAVPGNWDETRLGIAPGQSGVASSPHYKDQLDDWRNATPRTFPFTGPAVEKAAKETLTLVPVK